MRLHRHMRIQMIQRAIRFLASLPSTLVHPFDFFISTTRALVLLRARDGDKGVHLGQRMGALIVSAEGAKATAAAGGGRWSPQVGSPTWLPRGPAVAADPAADTAVPGEL